MEKDFIKKAMKQIPLSTRLDVLIEMSIIDIITKLGYREDKYWTDDENDKLSKIIKLSKELRKDILKEIERWKSDGMP